MGMSLTDDQIRAFRLELLEDGYARNTDVPYACLRALQPACSKLQKASREKARAVVAAAWKTWIAAGHDGVAAIITTIQMVGR